MNRDELKKHLCWHDRRSPYYIKDDFYDEEEEPPRESCACDSCYHGKSLVAECALELQSDLADLKMNLKTIYTLRDLREIKEVL